MTTEKWINLKIDFIIKKIANNEILLMLREFSWFKIWRNDQFHEIREYSLEIYAKQNLYPNT